jgi:hypothetical protein
MDAQTFRSLQETYLEVVENQQLNDGYNIFPHDKVKAKAKSLAPGRDDLGREPLTGPKAPNTPQKDLDRATMLRLAAHLHHSAGPKHREKVNKGPESLLYKKRSKTVSDNTVSDNTEKKKYFPNRLRRADGQGIADSYDYYDIILSHLLDEGYAETVEAAESIMVNMSEEWRESIVEEVLEEEWKPLPSRMAKQARRKAFRLGNQINDPESGIGLNVEDDPTARQLRNMARVGGKPVKRHIKKGYEQGSRYDPQNAELNWKRL